MLHPLVTLAVGSGLLCLLAWPGVALAEEPYVDVPPAPEAVCPAIAEDYALCREDPMSGNCSDFVDAAHALGRLYLFNVEREPDRANELQTTVWWQCGSASFAELKALLERIDSPASRAVLAEAPYRSLPALHARSATPLVTDPGRTATRARDCSSILVPAEYSACEQRILADAEARYRREVESCAKRLTSPLSDELVASEAAWRRDRGLECPAGDTGTRCLAAATQQRTEGIARGYPECRSEKATSSAAVREGPLQGGRRSGELPAQWTPHQGASRPVPFSFESQGHDTTQGTMHTTLGKGGERFEGDYLRIQQSTKGDLVTAVSVGWSGPEWQLWKHDSDGGWTQEGVSVGEFAHFYNGKVVATLAGDRGHSMRCQFVLKDPEAGLLEGGTGRCQVTDGGSLALAF